MSRGGDRLEAMFARTRAEGRPALIIFTPCGFPERGATVDVVKAAIDGGADAVEIGFPFSDPLGDGPTNQRAYDSALRDGFVPSQLWEVVRRLRSDGVSVPLLIMGYFNPLFAYGVSKFVQDAANAGIDGLILVDLPPDEAAEIEQPVMRISAVTGTGIESLLEALWRLARPVAVEKPAWPPAPPGKLE